MPDPLLSDEELFMHVVPWCLIRDRRALRRDDDPLARAHGLEIAETVLLDGVSGVRSVLELRAEGGLMPRPPTLLDRLDAGDELHREAAAAIRQLRRDLNDQIRTANRDARDACAEGRHSAREEMEGW